MKLRICSLTILLTALCGGQETFRAFYERQNAEASRLHSQKEYAKSIAILEELRKQPELQNMDDQLLHVLYNLACDYSLAGDKDQALATLRLAAATGSLTSASLQRDSDFDNIRQDAAFKQLVEELQKVERPLELLWNSSAWQTPFREDLPATEKIAGLSQLWSEAKHNYVFFYRLDGIDWDSLFMSYLPRVQAATSTYEYYEVLAEFCARLRDGHTSVSFPRELRARLGWPAITTRLVEDRVFVDVVRDPVLKGRGITRGLEILAVDGTPVREYGREKVAPKLSASTPQDREVRTYENSLLGGLIGKPVALKLQNESGKVLEVTLSRLSQTASNNLPRVPWERFEYKVLPSNIAYVALRTFGNDAVAADFEAAFSEIRKSDALILDVRENGGGSSGVGWTILGYLTAQPFQSTQWRTRDYKPAYRAWGRMESWYGQGASQLAPRNSDPYRKPVVVLTSAHTYSAAEDFVVVFDAMKRGRIIGEPTGGSTGQPLMIRLPGAGSARICTKHDRYPDGKEFVGTGVTPNLVVHPTVADFRAGRDTVLEAALAELRRAN